MNHKPRILLVGAGAVGQVFAHYLRAADAELSFLVKPKYADEARRGYKLYELTQRDRSPPPTLLSGFDLFVSEQDVARRRWDQVWLCVSSTAMRSGDWVEQLARNTGDATWVMLQPAPDDREWLQRWIPPERLVIGMIPFLSFHSPLRPEDPFPPPGTAFWFPPLARGLFSGPADRLEPLLRVLRAGGYPAGATADTPRASAIPTAVLTVVVAGLEAAGWRFERFLQPDSLERVHQAAREAVRIIAEHTGTSATFVLPLLRPTLFKALLPVASRVAPLDLETYLRVHFTKVGDQSQAILRTYIALGKRSGLTVRHLQDYLT